MKDIYFAQIIDGVVVNVIVVDESQAYRGDEFLSQDLGLPGKFVQTDINSENYAVINGFYNEEMNLFSPAQPFPSWIWDGLEWQPPVPMPETGGTYEWDEETLSWIEIPS